jgi:thymidylate kinase
MLAKNFQVGTEPDIVLFFDCPEDEMVKRLLGRNQVSLYTSLLNSMTDT